LWKELFVNYRNKLIVAVLLTTAMAVGNYYIIAYFVTFLTQTQNLPAKQVMIINLLALILVTALIPFYGFLSDLWGRKKIFYYGLISLMLAAYPVFLLLTQANLLDAFLGQVIFAIFLAAVCGVVPIMLAELFPTRIRNTGLSLGYNLALAIFGGTAPMVGLLMVQETGMKTSPAFYLIICCILSLWTLIFQKESYSEPLH
jgi:proline/betaine transport protein TphA